MSIERPFFPTETAPRPERGEAVSERLTNEVTAWRARHVLPMLAAVAMTTGLGGVALHTAMEGGPRVKSASASPEAVSSRNETKKTSPKPEIESFLGVDLRYEELRELDPEATPERVRTLLTTVPPALLENVSSIRFNNVQRASKKVAGAETVATAFGGEGEAKTPIVCWAEAKNIPSRELWTIYLLHEIFHANDWRTLEWYDKEAASKLKQALEHRVRAKDRFMSGYVESIHDQNKKDELEDRALEYWGEIGAAYLNGDPLPQADKKIVEDVLAVIAPAFDRNAAMEARNKTLDEMSEEEASKEYAALPQEERASIDAWVQWRMGVEAEQADLLLQREGRKEVLAAYQSAFARLGQSNEARDYLLVLSNYYDARENLFEAKAEGDPVKTRVALGRVTLAYEDLEGLAASIPDSDDIQQDLDGVMNRYSVWIGGETHQMHMQPDEYRTWTESQQNYWRVMPFNWDVPLDPIDHYLDQKSFTPPEEVSAANEEAEHQS